MKENYNPRKADEDEDIVKGLVIIIVTILVLLPATSFWAKNMVFGGDIDLKDEQKLGETIGKGIGSAIGSISTGFAAGISEIIPAMIDGGVRAFEGVKLAMKGREANAIAGVTVVGVLVIGFFFVRGTLSAQAQAARIARN